MEEKEGEGQDEEGGKKSDREAGDEEEEEEEIVRSNAGLQYLSSRTSGQGRTIPIQTPRHKRGI